MTTRMADAALPPQLGGLAAQAQHLPAAVRDALQATLWAAAGDATPEAVLLATFARLGYLPGEASQATLKLLAAAAA